MKSSSPSRAQPSAFDPLPPFRRRRRVVENLALKGTLYAISVLLGLTYGVLFVLFPPQLMMPSLLPIAILLFVVIWALPDFQYRPNRILPKLLFAYILALTLWPDYLSMRIPGLPWISLRRLISYSTVLTLLFTLSVNPGLRKRIVTLKEENKPFFLMLVVFTLLQFLTLVMSSSPLGSLNATIDFWVSATAFMVVALLFLADREKNESLFKLMAVSATVLCIIGLFEGWNGRILWADHIPALLQVSDEAVQRILTPQFRDGEYRVTGIFTVSLCLAEFLAMATPFIFHKVFVTPSIIHKCLWVALDLFVLAIIDITQSRLGIVGWLLAHGVYILLWAAIRWKNLRTDIMGPSLSLGAIAGGLFLVVGMFSIPAIRNRTIGGGSTSYSDNAREIQYDLLWPKLLANPFGHGTGQSGLILGYVQPGGLISVDSYIITMLIDYGIVGAICFFGMLIFAAWKMLYRTWHLRDGEEGDLALPLFAFMLVIIQIRTVLSQTDNLPLMLIFTGLCIALDWKRPRVPEKA